MSQLYSELPWEEQKLVMLYTVHGRAMLERLRSRICQRQHSADRDEVAKVHAIGNRKATEPWMMPILQYRDGWWSQFLQACKV